MKAVLPSTWRPDVLEIILSMFSGEATQPGSVRSITANPFELKCLALFFRLLAPISTTFCPTGSVLTIECALSRKLSGLAQVWKFPWMFLIRVLSSSHKVSLGIPCRVTGRVLLEQKVVICNGALILRLTGMGILYASMALSVVAPSEHFSVAVTTAVHVASKPTGLFSYMLSNHVAISIISLANVPGH
jgi:hypothetical protein